MLVPRLVPSGWRILPGVILKGTGAGTRNEESGTRCLHVARGGDFADAPKGCFTKGKGETNKEITSPKDDPPDTPRVGDTLENHPSRIGFNRMVENGINCQIQAELNASHFYTSLATSFGRVDVALRGLERFFWRAANQERNDALNLADYQNKRGGIVSLKSVQDPGPSATTSPKDALTNSLQLQRSLTQQLLSLYSMANDSNDPVTCDFLSEYFLKKQVKRLSRNGRYITQLCRIGDSGLAVHDFDEWLFRELPSKYDVYCSIMKSHSENILEKKNGNSAQRD